MTLHHDPVDEWGAFDDTLADRQDRTADGELPLAGQAWLADQRVVHGLLRSLQRSTSAEGLAAKDAVIARIRCRTRPRLRLVRWCIAAAALMAVAFVFVLARANASDRLGQQVLQRVTDALARPLDRTFALTERTFAKNGGVDDGRSFQSEPLVDGKPSMYATRGLMDPDYLDLHALAQRLLQTGVVRVVGRETDLGGVVLVRLEVLCEADRPLPRIRTVGVLCAEETGDVKHLEIHIEGHQGYRRVAAFDCLGVVEGDASRYARPW
jgi:hypothetical protein